MPVTISELTDELVGLVQSVPSVGEKGFSVFNMAEVQYIAGQVGYPMVGVSYEGATPIDGTANAKHKTFKSTGLVTLSFLLVIGVTYRYASDIDNKPTATNLLDEVRSIVLGYKGINNRPWKYAGELPLPSDLEGAILYGQMWETEIPIIGNSPN